MMFFFYTRPLKLEHLTRPDYHTALSQSPHSEEVAGSTPTFPPSGVSASWLCLRGFSPGSSGFLPRSQDAARVQAGLTGYWELLKVFDCDELCLGPQD